MLEKLVLRMSPASVWTILRGVPENRPEFDVVLDEGMPLHTLVFCTEAEWDAGKCCDEQYDRWINFAGHAMRPSDVRYMWAHIRDPAQGYFDAVFERFVRWCDDRADREWVD